jgi:hypothetical protein
MTVAEMVEWLKTQDQSAIVQVIFHETGYGYYNQGGTARTVVFDPNNHVDHYEKELLLGVYER